MDLCKLDACICDDQGHLVQLNMRSAWLGVCTLFPCSVKLHIRLSHYRWEPHAADYGMTCDFPGAALSEFTSLTAAYLGYNNFTGRFETVAASLAALKHLRELNLYGNTHIGGDFGADDNSGACLLAKVGRRMVLQ
jgi:hypothetical protein